MPIRIPTEQKEPGNQAPNWGDHGFEDLYQNSSKSYTGCVIV